MGHEKQPWIGEWFWQMNLIERNALRTEWLESGWPLYTIPDEATYIDMY